MDDCYLCPDCYAEHREPLEAGLGHFALCLNCAVPAAPPALVVFESLELEISVAA